MSVHQIRLAGPWELLSGEASAASPDSPQQGLRQSPSVPRRSQARCQLPYDAEVTGLHRSATQGTVSLCRRFHKPAGLKAETQVRLVFITNAPHLSLTLNQHSLAEQVIAATPNAEVKTSHTKERTSHAVPQDATAESPVSTGSSGYRIVVAAESLLLPFNQLIVELACDSSAGSASLLHSAVLEIVEQD